MLKNDELWEKQGVSSSTGSARTERSFDDLWDGPIASKIRSKAFDIAEVAPVADIAEPKPVNFFKPSGGFSPPIEARVPGTVARKLEKTSILQESNVIILVLGAPLSGKSTFINNYFSNPHLAPVHHQLFPPSHDMTGYLHIRDTDKVGWDGRSVVLVDTPGPFSWKSDDLGIVKDIVELLLKGRELEQTIRILYLHDISTPKMSVDVLMSLSLLKALCGQTAWKNVWMATTQWNLTPGGDYSDTTDPSFMGPLPPRGFQEREGHLQTVYWKEFLEGGAHYWRIQGRAHERALVEEIYESTLDTGGQRRTSRSNDDSAPFEFAIQKEMQQDQLAFPSTATGKAMKSCLMRALEEEIKSGGDKERMETLKRQHKELTRTAQPKRRFAIGHRST
ncbi:hypothetical protein MD484_g5108, partial [Candolleomyces efflorescens]